MSANVLFYNYYYRYKQARKTVKDLVIANDFQNAKTLLDSYVAEHDNYTTSRNITVNDSTFTGIDNMSLHHGQDHLDAAATDSLQKQATINALNENEQGG